MNRCWLTLVGFALAAGNVLAQTTGGTNTGTGTTGGGGVSTGTGTGTGGGMNTFAPTQGIAPSATSSFLPNAGATAPGAAATAGNPGNPFNTWYASPLALGLPTRSARIGGAITGTSTIPWGTALYSNVYSTTRTGTGTANRGLGGGGGLLNRGGAFGGGLVGGTLGGFNSSALSGSNSGRPPGYITVMQPHVRANGAGGQIAELQQLIARSSALPSRNSIQVHGEDVIVLRGVVSSERERRLAENLLRLSPGVSVIRNELLVQP